VHPHTSYLILATPRSGSYLLCEALINTRLAGYPTEYFGPIQTRAFLKHLETANYAEYLDWIIKKGTTPNGVFGGKLIWQFHEDLTDHLREITGYEKLSMREVLSAAFPNLRYIWTTRRDKVRQAISYWKALQTDAWLGLSSEDMQSSLIGDQQETRSNLRMANRPRLSTTKDPIFDYKSIERLLRGLEQDEVEIQRYCANLGIQPFKVVYEDFVDAYEETALQILAYLHIPAPQNLTFGGTRKLQKQANKQSEEWLQRYYQAKQQEDAEIAGTGQARAETVGTGD